MKPTKDGRGFLIYRCRNCGEEIYSNLVTDVDSMFLKLCELGPSASICRIHDCSVVRTGLADLIGYTGTSEELECSQKDSLIVYPDFAGPPTRVSFKEEEKHRWKNWFKRLKKTQEEQDKIESADKCDE